MLIAITASILLAALLMLSQAMESMTRAFYSRSDLDLILASPVAAHRLFAVRQHSVQQQARWVRLIMAGVILTSWIGVKCTYFLVGT